MSFLITVLVVLLGIFLFTVLFGAPYVPSRQIDIDTILAKLKVEGLFVDLGCGDGKVLLSAARHGYSVAGYEINPILWAIARYRLRRYNAKIYLKSYMSADLSKANVVYVFGASLYIKKLTHKLRQVKKGSTIISYGFALPGKSSEEVVGGSYIYHL